MNKMQRLALAQGLYSKLGEIVSTKNPDSLRSELDDRARFLYETDGIKSRDVVINGVKVATYSVKTKQQPAEKPLIRTFLHIENEDEFYTWLANSGRMTIEAVVRENPELFYRLFVEELGEIPDGCFVESVELTPGQPERPPVYAGTVLRVDTEKLAMALGPQLPGEVAKVLTDGGGE